jgi:DnaJ-class molecular chaperone
MSRRQIPVGRCSKCGAPAYNATRINEPCGRTTNGKTCRAVIESTLNETDWKECPACTGYGLTGDRMCEQCDGVGWLFVRR